MQEVQSWDDAWCTDWNEMQLWEYTKETPEEATWFEEAPQDPSPWVPSHETKPWWNGYSRDRIREEKGPRCKNLEDLIGIAYPTIEFGAWQSLGTEASIVES